MDKKEFIDKVICTLQDFYGDEAEVISNDVLKNNGIKKMAISVRFAEAENTNIAPVIYLDKYYASAHEIEFEEIIGQIISMAERHKNPIGLSDVFTKIFNREFVLENVYPQLINTKLNKEFIETGIVHRDFLDLSVVYSIRINESNDGIAKVKVTNELLSSIDCSEQELYSASIHNMRETEDYKLVSMRKLLWGYLGEETDDGNLQCIDNDMLVLSCNSGINGAAGILDELFIEEVCGKTKYYILPSSIHELIFIRAEESMEVDDLNEMIREVNKTQLEVEDVLSDHLYVYIPGCGITMCA